MINYYNRIIKPHLCKIDKTEGFLFLDSARCHLTSKSVEAAVANRIEIIKIPPKMTNILQPADASSFGAIKKEYHRR
jgi:hypothetical protein